MLSRLRRPAASALALFLAALPCASFSQASRDNKKHDKPSREKNISNFDGGIFFLSDGDLPNGPCFRINGRVSASDFFEDLKRFDYEDADTVYRRGKDTVTQFPDKLRLEFTIHDFPCSLKIDQPPTRGYLTRPEIETLRVSLYWKRGIDLRPVEFIARPQLFVHPRQAPAPVGTEELPERFEWFYVYDIASVEVPVTDSLVVILRTLSGSIVARVAARM